MWRSGIARGVSTVALHHKPEARRTLRGVGGVGGLNTYNKDLLRPIEGSIVPYPPPPAKDPYDEAPICAVVRSNELRSTQ